MNIKLCSLRKYVLKINNTNWMGLNDLRFKEVQVLEILVKLENSVAGTMGFLGCLYKCTYAW